MRTSAPGQPGCERALDRVEDRRPRVVLQHVVASRRRDLRRGVGCLGHEAEALLELLVVVVDETRAGPVAVPAVDRARTGGDDERARQPRLHDRAREALVGRRLDVRRRRRCASLRSSSVTYPRSITRSAIDGGGSTTPWPIVTSDSGRSALVTARANAASIRS